MKKPNYGTKLSKTQQFSRGCFYEFAVTGGALSQAKKFVSIYKEVLSSYTDDEGGVHYRINTENVSSGAYVKWIGNSNSIQHLDLTHNLTNQGFKALADLLVKNTQMPLSILKVGDVDLKSLSKVILSKTGIVELTLRCGLISERSTDDDEIALLAKSIANVGKLTKLRFEYESVFTLKEGDKLFFERLVDALIANKVTSITKIEHNIKTSNLELVRALKAKIDQFTSHNKSLRKSTDKALKKVDSKTLEKCLNEGNFQFEPLYAKKKIAKMKKVRDGYSEKYEKFKKKYPGKVENLSDRKQLAEKKYRLQKEDSEKIVRLLEEKKATVLEARKASLRSLREVKKKPEEKSPSKKSSPKVASKKKTSSHKKSQSKVEKSSEKNLSDSENITSSSASSQESGVASSSGVTITTTTTTTTRSKSNQEKTSAP